MPARFWQFCSRGAEIKRTNESTAPCLEAWCCLQAVQNLLSLKAQPINRGFRVPDTGERAGDGRQVNVLAA